MSRAPVRPGTPEDFAQLRRVLQQHATRPRARASRGFWVYGAGGFGRRTARELVGAGEHVLGFVDRSGGADVDGRRCLTPAQVTREHAAGAVLVDAVMNDTTESASAVAWASAAGFADIAFPADVARIPGVRLDDYWFASFQQTLDHLDDLEVVHDLLDDPTSRSVLRSLLLYRCTTDPRLHPAVDPAIYTPDFLPVFEERFTFVDAGAYTGDTLEVLLQAGVALSSWVAVEPDQLNLVALEETARRRRDRVPRTSVVAAALSDVNGRAAFAAGSGAASHLVAPDLNTLTTAVEVDVVRLDDVVDVDGPVYVKMDVEGGERKALAGMPRLLSRGPVLAVSIYHRPEDLWELPLLVRELCGDVRLSIRQHGQHAFDTVLYAYAR